MLAADVVTTSNALPGLIGAVVVWGLSAPVLVHYARKWADEAREDRRVKVEEIEKIRHDADARIEAASEERAAWHERRNEIQREWFTERLASQEQVLALRDQLATTTAQADRLMELHDRCREREADLRERIARLETGQQVAARDVERLAEQVAQTPRRKDDVPETEP